MIADNPNPSEIRPQPLKLKFNFYTQRDKLIIEAENQKDNQLYIGEINPHPLVHFDTIKELIVEGKVKIISKNEDAMRIRIGTTPLELISKSRNEVKQLKEKLKNSITKQKEMETMIESQKNVITQLKQSVTNLTNTVEELKKTTQILVTGNQQLNNKVKDMQLKLDDHSAGFQRQNMKLYHLEVQSKKQEDLIKNIQENRLKPQTRNLITQNQQKLFVSVDGKVLFGPGSVFGSGPKTNYSPKQIVKASDLFNKPSDNNIFRSVPKKQQEKSPFTGLFNLLKNDQLIKPNENIQKVTQNKLSWKWSQTLKSNKISINRNSITLSTESDHGEISLIEAAFPQSLKTKQAWGIKIKNKTDLISIGICLKSVMQKHNFSSQKMTWLQIGHGQYSINSQGLSLNHSNNQFNNEKKSFPINQNDLIIVEYDPVELSLWFGKNRSGKSSECFQMPIQLPPQNDEYHPFVLMRGQQECVQLIYPVK